MRSEWEETRVTWYLGANSDMSGDLVVASVQKLTRPEGLAELDRQRFAYVVIDEDRLGIVVEQQQRIRGGIDHLGDDLQPWV